MPLYTEKNSRNIYVNISKGKFYTKESGKEPIFYGELEGYITGIAFKNDVYNGKQFEILQVFVSDDDDNFVLQMRTDSGYFRTFCNALKSGKIHDKIRFSPFYSEENGKTRTVLFLKQNSVPLKFYHTLKNLGDLPPLEKIIFKGVEQYDGSKQIQYWKNYLQSLNFIPIPQNMEITAEDLVKSYVDFGKTENKQDQEFTEDLPF